MKCESIYCFTETDHLYSVIFMKPSKHISINLCERCYATVCHTLTRLVGESKKSEYNNYIATVAQSGRAMV